MHIYLNLFTSSILKVYFLNLNYLTIAQLDWTRLTSIRGIKFDCKWPSSYNLSLVYWGTTQTDLTPQWNVVIYTVTILSCVNILCLLHEICFLSNQHSNIAWIFHSEPYTFLRHLLVALFFNSTSKRICCRIITLAVFSGFGNLQLSFAVRSVNIRATIFHGLTFSAQYPDWRFNYCRPEIFEGRRFQSEIGDANLIR